MVLVTQIIDKSVFVTGSSNDIYIDSIAHLLGCLKISVSMRNPMFFGYHEIDRSKWFNSKFLSKDVSSLCWTFVGYPTHPLPPIRDSLSKKLSERGATEAGKRRESLVRNNLVILILFRTD